jgi:hypothetical protein
MYRLLATATLLLTLVLAPVEVSVIWGASAPAFPYRTYSEVPAEPIGPACQGDATELRTAEWRILSSSERDIFLHLDPAGSVDYVYFIKDTSKEGVMNVVRVLTLEEARKAYPAGPCVYFRE